MTTTEPESATGAEGVLERLRTQAPMRHILRGFGPLVLALLLIVTMIVLAPSVAPERIVVRPVGSAATEAGE